jgi:hypothetical protein
MSPKSPGLRFLLIGLRGRWNRAAPARHWWWKRHAHWVLALLALCVVALASLVWFRRLKFDEDGIRYALSADAQVMAAALALTFAISQIMLQTAARHGLYALRSTNTIVSIGLLLLYVVAIVAPLSALGVAFDAGQPILCLASLAYSAFCLLLLVPYFVWMGNALDPERIYEAILPARQVQRLNYVGVPEKLLEIESVFASAVTMADFKLAMGGVRWMEQAVPLTLQPYGFLQVRYLLQSLFSMVIWTRGNPSAVLYVLDMVSRAGRALGRAGRQEEIYNAALKEMVKRVEETKLGRLGWLAVKNFMELCREYAETSRRRFDSLDFLRAMAPVYVDLVQSTGWGAMQRDIGVEWCKGLWLLAGTMLVRNGEASLGSNDVKYILTLICDMQTHFRHRPNVDGDIAEAGRAQAAEEPIVPKVTYAITELAKQYRLLFPDPSHGQQGE